MKIILWIVGIVVGGFVLLLAVGSGQRSWLRLPTAVDSSSANNGARSSWAQGSNGSWVQVSDTPENEANRANDEKARQRNGIAYCWTEQARKSLDPATARFVAATCEKMEADFVRDFNNKP